MLQAAISHSTPAPGAAIRILRPQLEQLIETLLAMLDTIDGDPDLEEDDPAGDPLDRGEQDGMSDLMPAPIWGIDQSRGPINVEEAGEVYHAAKLASGERWFVA